MNKRLDEPVKRLFQFPKRLDESTKRLDESTKRLDDPIKRLFQAIKRLVEQVERLFQSIKQFWSPVMSLDRLKKPFDGLIQTFRMASDRVVGRVNPVKQFVNRFFRDSMSVVHHAFSVNVFTV